jgi:hypothetical protein
VRGGAGRWVLHTSYAEESNAVSCCTGAALLALAAAASADEVQPHTGSNRHSSGGSKSPRCLHAPHES